MRDRRKSWPAEWSDPDIVEAAVSKPRLFAWVMS
jgi:hypothetical protein